MEETLGLTIKRSTRSKVAPFQQQFLGYSGQTDSSGQPDGKGTLTYTDDSLLWMSGAFRADSDGIQNGVYKGVFKHGKVASLIDCSLLFSSKLISFFTFILLFFPLL